MHGFVTVRLREYKRTDRLPRLLQPEFTEQTDDLRVDVDRPHLSAFRSIQVDTRLRGIAQVAADRYGTRAEVDVLPLKAAALAPAYAGVDQQTHKDAPFERLGIYGREDALKL